MQQDNRLMVLGDHTVPAEWAQYVKHNEVEGSTPGAPIQWDDPSDPESALPGYGFVADNSTEEETFYYHSDHLGSTSYITDKDGNITQYDAYLPYGELLVDEHSSSEEMPYKFNGKELDEETGLYYYGARYMQPMVSIWYGIDPLTEEYANMGAYVYCASNPIKLFDPDGRDWYWDTDKTIQYNPHVHSAKDLRKGQSYIGSTYKTKHASYRKDGSILFHNERKAYNRMWDQANRHYREKGEKGGREEGAFILNNGKVLVMPDYKNDSRNSKISEYGYKITEGLISKGKESYHVVAQIHTHQDKTGDANPSFYCGDDKISAILKRPVFTMSHDRNIWYILSNKQSYDADITPFKLTNLLYGSKYSFAKYAADKKWRRFWNK